MKKILLLVVLLAFSKLIDATNATEFAFFVPSYNNEKYVIDNLRSICFQKSSRPYRVITINDRSTDKTGILMDEFVRQNHLESKVTVIHNEVNIGMVENAYRTVHSLPDHVVVVCVDGDDEAYDNNVLLRLEKEYADPDVWVTYGSQTPNYEFLLKGLPKSVFHEKKVRQHPFITSHLRTYKAGLFKKIKKEDLCYDGKFLSVSGDLAIMFPLLEMAGAKRVRHIKDTLYRYQEENPLRDCKVRKAQQEAMAAYIKNLPAYERIPYNQKLFVNYN